MSWALGFALAKHAVIVGDGGDLDQARALLRESIDLRSRARDRSGWGESKAILAEMERRSGNSKLSAQLWTDALDCRLTIGEPIGVAECIEGVAILALDQRDFEISTRLLAGAAAERERLGAPIPLRYRQAFEERDRELERALGSFQWMAAVREGRGLEMPVLAALAHEYAAMRAKP